MRREWVAILGSVCNAKRMRALPDNTCRLLYLLLQTQCDSWGRVGDDPDKLWADCWATFGAQCSLEETIRALDELVRVELIERHNANGVAWIQIPDWEQKAGAVGEKKKRGRSKFPDRTRDSVATQSRVSPEQVEHRREESREREEHSTSATRAREDEPITERPDVDEPPPDCPSRMDAALVFHVELDSPEVRAALIDFEKHRADGGKSAWTRQAWNRLCLDWKRHGTAEQCQAWVIRACDTAMRAGAYTPFQSDHDERKAPGPPPKSTAQRNAEDERRTLEREVERRWNAKHETTIEVEVLGEKRRMPGLDAKYPGYEAARAELNGSVKA